MDAIQHGRKRVSPPVGELASARAGAGIRVKAAHALGIARLAVLHKVQHGQLQAVYVNLGRRQGLRIQVKPDQTGLLDTPR